MAGSAQRGADGQRLKPQRCIASLLLILGINISAMPSGPTLMTHGSDKQS